MTKPETKLARLVNWVREHMDRQGAFLKSDLYTYARGNGIERSALDLVYRCRSMGTIRDKNAKRVEVVVSKGKNLEQFYKALLKIQDEPVLRGRPMPPIRRKTQPEVARLKEPPKGKQPETKTKKEPPKARQPEPESKKEAQKGMPARVEKRGEPPKEMEKEPIKPAVSSESPDRIPGLAGAVAEKLEGRFKRIDDTVASINNLVGKRIDDLEQRVGVVIVKELEKRIRQLEAQLEEFRAKAEAFDLIKRDVWEIVEALEVVEAERDDVKKVLNKFRRP